MSGNAARRALPHGRCVEHEDHGTRAVRARGTDSRHDVGHRGRTCASGPVPREARRSPVPTRFPARLRRRLIVCRSLVPLRASCAVSSRSTSAGNDTSCRRRRSPRPRPARRSAHLLPLRFPQWDRYDSARIPPGRPRPVGSPPVRVQSGRERGDERRRVIPFSAPPGLPGRFRGGDANTTPSPAPTDASPLSVLVWRGQQRVGLRNAREGARPETLRIGGPFRHSADPRGRRLGQPPTGQHHVPPTVAGDRRSFDGRDVLCAAHRLRKSSCYQCRRWASSGRRVVSLCSPCSGPSRQS